MSVCLYCGQQIPFLSRLRGETRFCSKGHHALYRRENEHLALEAIRQVGAVSAPAPPLPLAGQATNTFPEMAAARRARPSATAETVPPFAPFQSDPARTVCSADPPRIASGELALQFSESISFPAGLSPDKAGLVFAVRKEFSSFRAVAGIFRIHGSVDELPPAPVPAIAALAANGVFRSAMGGADLLALSKSESHSDPSHDRKGVVFYNASQRRALVPLFHAAPQDVTVAPVPSGGILLGFGRPSPAAPEPCRLPMPVAQVTTAAAPSFPALTAQAAVRALEKAGLQSSAGSIGRHSARFRDPFGHRAGTVVPAFPTVAAPARICAIRAIGLQSWFVPAARRAQRANLPGFAGTALVSHDPVRYALPGGSSVLGAALVLPAAGLGKRISLPGPNTLRNRPRWAVLAAISNRIAPPGIPSIRHATIQRGIRSAAAELSAPSPVEARGFSASQAAALPLDMPAAAIAREGVRSAARPLFAPFAELLASGIRPVYGSATAAPRAFVAESPARYVVRDVAMHVTLRVSLSSANLQPAFGIRPAALPSRPEEVSPVSTVRTSLPRFNLSVSEIERPAVIESRFELAPSPIRRDVPTLNGQIPVRLEDLTADSAPQAIVEDAAFARSGVFHLSRTPIGEPRAIVPILIRPRQPARFAQQPRTERLDTPGLFIPQLRLGPLRPRITYGAQDFEASAMVQKTGRRGAVIPISERRNPGKHDVETATRARGSGGTFR